jgi:hypothetical protein
MKRLVLQIEFMILCLWVAGTHLAVVVDMTCNMLRLCRSPIRRPSRAQKCSSWEAGRACSIKVLVARVDYPSRVSSQQI